MDATECVICTETPGADKLTRLPCAHYHCHSCLARQLELCVKANPFRPVRCCEIIAVTTLRDLPTVQTATVREYRPRLTEHLARNKLYCHVPTCATFIPAALRSTRSASCRRCRAKTCCRCGQKWHFGGCTSLLPGVAAAAEVGPSPEMLLWQLAKQRGWKRCPTCRAMVSKISGCNHMVLVSPHPTERVGSR